MDEICLLINNTELLDKQRLSLKLAKNAKQREAQIEICVVYKKKNVYIDSNTIMCNSM